MIYFKGFILFLFFLLQFLNGEAQHFTTVFSGNPYNPMNILVTNISVDNQQLELGDEIGVFDGKVCVGACIYKGDENLGISVSMDDPIVKEKDGFKFGNSISFKIWKRKINFEYINIEAIFNPLLDTVYIPLGTAFVELRTSIAEQKPKIYPNQLFSVEENATQNTIIGQLKIDFPLEKISFRVLENEHKFPFSIDSVGVISVNDPELIDYNQRTYSIPILVYYDNNEELSDSSTFKIDIIRIPPSIINLKNDTAFVGSGYKQILKIEAASSKILSVIPSTIPSWISVYIKNSNEIVFEGTPGFEDIGTSEVSFSLSDETNLIQQRFLIETIKKETTPSISLNNNPTHGPFKIIFDQFEEEDVKIEVSIKKLNGGIVYKNFINSTGNSFSIDVDLSGNTKAIYLVGIRYKNYVITKKLLLL